MAPIRVLIVDDSAFMRHALSRLINESPRLEVVGAAANGEEGLRLAAELRPDVITLDVEMPVLDGLGMLRRLMLETPTRVVMLSSRTTQNDAAAHAIHSAYIASTPVASANSTEATSTEAGSPGSSTSSSALPNTVVRALLTLARISTM